MKLSIKYIIENIRIKYWTIYLSLCVSKIKELLTNIYFDNYKLEQKILYFNTFLLGICEESTTIIFPKTQCIIDNKHVLLEDILHNYKITNDEFEKIILLIIKIKSKCKKQMFIDINNINSRNIKLELTEINDFIELKVDDQNKEYSNNFKISIKDYKRLNKLYIKEKNIDWMIVILLTRYKYYGYVKEGISLSAEDVYNFIKINKYGNDTLEAFAGTLNSNLLNYCSLFYDIEKYFKSKGSFLKITNTCDYKIIINNPPYLSNVMNMASSILLKFLNNCDNLFIVCIVPDWRSIQEYNDSSVITFNETKQSRQNVIYKSYNDLRKSKYYQYTLCIGNYKYYNFFSNTYKSIRDNTLFIVLEKNKNNNNISNTFKEYMINILKKYND